MSAQREYFHLGPTPDGTQRSGGFLAFFVIMLAIDCKWFVLSVL